MDNTYARLGQFVLDHGLVTGDDAEDLRADLADGAIDRTGHWDMWDDLSLLNAPELWEARDSEQQIAYLCAHFRVSPL